MSNQGIVRLDTRCFTLLAPFSVQTKLFLFHLTLSRKRLRLRLDTWEVLGMMAARRHGKRIGYIRVSSVDQNTLRQLDGVEVEKTFTDKASGKNTARPQLQAAREYLRDGDVLVVHSMDRLARNLTDLRSLVKELNHRGVAVEFVKESLSFTGEDSPMANLLLSMLGAVAEFERALILERQREGIAIAKAAGKYRGGKLKLTDDKATELRRRAAAGENKAALAKEYGISRQSLYNTFHQRPPIAAPTPPQTALEDDFELSCTGPRHFRLKTALISAFERCRSTLTSQTASALSN